MMFAWWGIYAVIYRVTSEKQLGAWNLKNTQYLVNKASQAPIWRSIYLS